MELLGTDWWYGRSLHGGVGGGSAGVSSLAAAWNSFRFDESICVQLIVLNKMWMRNVNIEGHRIDMTGLWNCNRNWKWLLHWSRATYETWWQLLVL